MKVSEYLERVYEEIDKEGMPYFEESDLLRRFVTATYFFLEDNTPFIQSNQKAKEDLSMLTVPFDYYNQTNGLFQFDESFYRLVSLGAKYNGRTRGVPIVQSNDLEKLKDDPFHSPNSDEPLAQFFQNSLKIEPTPESVHGLYLKHPLFGASNDNELIEGLPIHIQLFLVEKVVLHLMTTIGDPRYQMQYYQVQNKNTVS